jgi:lysophospholipase L1-like esterase
VSRRRRRSRLLGVLVLLALLEGSLQLAAPLIQWGMSRVPERPDPDAPLTVLCVGDSNTYGLHLPQVYAYPALLASELSTRYRRPVQVVNRGVPGQGSAQVARHLLDDLSTTEPELVLILAGINDAWNSDAQDAGPFSWLGHLRLVRLARVLTAGVTTAQTFEITTDEEGEIVVDRGDGAARVNAGEGSVGTLAGEALAAAVRTGLGRSLAIARDQGAEPVLLTYAEGAGPFATVNDAIRATARDEEVLLIDVALAFEGHFAREGYDTLMFADHHPNLRGYRLVARQAAESLERAGLVPPPLPLAERAATGVRTPERPPELELVPDGGLLVRGPAGWAWQVLVSCAPGPDDGFPAGSTWVPLPADEVLAVSRLEPGFSGRLGDSGEALVRISPALRARASCPLAACLLLLNDDPGPLVPDGEIQAIAACTEVLLLP